MSEIQKTIDGYVELMKIPKEKNFVTPHEAEWRAGEFLVACAQLANWRNLYTNAHIAAQAHERVAYKLALARCDSKQITEKKVIAEADPEYQEALKKSEELDKDISFFKQYYEIFSNAHVFFRQLSNQIHKESH